MALQLKFRTSQTSRDCDCFYIWDDTGTYDATTNPGGYGTPNIDTTDVVQWTVTINDGFNLWTYTSTAAVPLGIENAVRICASAFTNSGDSTNATSSTCDVCPEGSSRGMTAIGLTPPTDEIMGTITDRCVSVTYTIFTETTITCTACDYSIAISESTVTPALGETIWLNVNGVWVDYTSQFVFDTNQWEYSIADSCDEITGYRIVNVNGVPGVTVPVIGTSCGDKTINPTEPTKYASVENNTTFTCHTSDRLSALVLELETSDCVNCNTLADERLCDLMKVRSLLEAAQAGYCNCDCANKLLRMSDQILTKIENDCP